jgi:hypothetical protein
LIPEKIRPDLKFFPYLKGIQEGGGEILHVIRGLVKEVKSEQD